MNADVVAELERSLAALKAEQAAQPEPERRPSPAMAGERGWRLLLIWLFLLIYPIVGMLVIFASSYVHPALPYILGGLALVWVWRNSGDVPDNAHPW